VLGERESLRLEFRGREIKKNYIESLESEASVCHLTKTISQANSESGEVAPFQSLIQGYRDNP